MKKSALITFIILIISLNYTKAQINDEETIKTLINKAYTEGLHNGGNLDETKKGFHPGFDLLILQNNQLVKLPIYNWVETTERSRKDPATPQRPKTSVNFVNIDITGTAAMAKIELSREGKLIFTDYLSLYKFEDGWKIVGKIYYKHQ